MDVVREFDKIDESSSIRYQAYDRIMGNISWLLIALVSLDIKLLPHDNPGLFFLALLCVMLLARTTNSS